MFQYQLYVKKNLKADWNLVLYMFMVMVLMAVYDELDTNDNVAITDGTAGLVGLVLVE